MSHRNTENRYISGKVLFYVKLPQVFKSKTSKAKMCNGRRHESGCRILPTQPHIGLGDFQITCSIEL